MQVEIWSDVVCPWCYIGKRRFEQALEQFPQRDQVEVQYRSFQLDPTAEAGAHTPVAESLAAKYGRSLDQVSQMMANVTAAAADVGLEYDLSRTVKGNTTEIHRLLHYANLVGKQADLMERIFSAYFIDGEIVFEHTVLLRLAEEAGLDAQAARRVLEEGQFAEEVDADLQLARDFGVSGVPFFVFERKYAVSGAQPADVFLSALETIAREAEPVAAGVSGAACEA